MKKLIPSFALLALCGCSATNMTKLAAQLKNDPATVHLTVKSIYGTLEFTRINAGTNSLTHTLHPDGTITVEKTK